MKLTKSDKVNEEEGKMHFTTVGFLHEVPNSIRTAENKKHLTGNYLSSERREHLRSLLKDPKYKSVPHNEE